VVSSCVGMGLGRQLFLVSLQVAVSALALSLCLASVERIVRAHCVAVDGWMGATRGTQLISSQCTDCAGQYFLGEPSDSHGDTQGISD